MSKKKQIRRWKVKLSHSLYFKFKDMIDNLPTVELPEELFGNLQIGNKELFIANDFLFQASMCYSNNKRRYLVKVQGDYYKQPYIIFYTKKDLCNIKINIALLYHFEKTIWK